MKILNVMIGLFLVLLMVPAVMAVDGSNLKITNLDVKVGSGSDRNIHTENEFIDGSTYTIDEPAKPGDKVVFDITVENNFTNNTKIEDIEIIVTIQDIDDEGDDDLEEEDDFDLRRGGRDKDLKFEFEIPIEVEDIEYIVLIEIEGEDEYGVTHRLEKTLELEVEKEDHEVLFLRNALTPSEIKCGRNVQLLTSILNIGSNDEDDVVLEVTNTELEINFRETFDLVEDVFDDESKFKKTFTINLPEDVEVGIYTINTKFTYDDGDETETETAELIVAQCEILEEEVEEEEEEEEEDVIVVQPPVTTEPTDVITAGVVTTPTLPVTEEKSLFETSGFLAAMIIGEVLLLIVAILIVVALVRKRGQ